MARDVPTAAVAADDLDPQEVGIDLLVSMARVIRWAGRHSQIPVPAAQTRVLSQLDEMGPSRISALAASDRCAQPTMSVLVQRLEEHGWVTREADPADTRASLISLNDAGRRALQDARRAAGAAIAGFLRERGADETARAAQAVALLRRVLEPGDRSSTDTAGNRTRAEAGA
jgi:DNA-binding MarR family transcriptional regulator